MYPALNDTTTTRHTSRHSLKSQGGEGRGQVEAIRRARGHQAEEVVDVEGRTGSPRVGHNPHTGEKGQGARHATRRTPRMHGTVGCSGRSHQYFRWYLPLLALSRQVGRGQLCTAGTLRPEAHIMRRKPRGKLRRHDIRPHANATAHTAASLLQQEACEQAAPVLLRLARAPRQGGVGEEVAGRHHSHLGFRGATGRTRAGTARVGTLIRPAFR